MESKEKKHRTVAITEGNVARTKIMYTTEQKLGAVKLLRDSNFDYNKVSVALGVNKGTLRSWALRYKNVPVDGATQVIAAKVEVNLQKLKVDFISKNYEKMDKLAQKAIERAQELVEREPDLNKVNNTIKILTDFFAKMHTPEENDTERPGSAVTVNLIQQTINQLNNK